MSRIIQIKKIFSVLCFGFFLVLISIAVLYKDFSSIPKLDAPPKLYYVLASDQARKQLQPIINLRKKQGLKIKYLDWKRGLDSIARIRSTRAYLLLVGTPQTQNKDFFLPRYQLNKKVAFVRKQLQTGFPIGEISTSFHTDISHENEKLIIGRLPARDAQDLQLMVRNTMNYEKDRKKSDRLLAFSKSAGFSKWLDAFIESSGRLASMFLLGAKKDFDWLHTSPGNVDTTTAVGSRLLANPDLVLHAGLGGDNLSGMIQLDRLSRFPIQSGPWILLSGQGGAHNHQLRDAEKLMLKVHGPPAVLFHSGIGHTYTDSLYLMRFMQQLDQKSLFKQKLSWGNLNQFSKMHLDSNSLLNRVYEFLCFAFVGLRPGDLKKLREYQRLSFQFYGDPALRVLF